MTTQRRRRGDVPGYRLEYREGRRSPWVVCARSGGRRVAMSFASKEKAERELARLVRERVAQGASYMGMTPAEYAVWRETLEVLAPFGVSPLEAALFYRQHGKRDCESVPVSEAAERFLDDKAGHGLSERHLRDLRSRVRAFASAFASTPVAHLTTADVLEWIRAAGGEPRTMRNNRGAVHNFLNFAARRGWTDKAPEVHDADLPRVRATSKGVLRVDEAAAVAGWLETHEPQWCAWFALQAFAGIRVAEVERMTWDMVDFAGRRLVLPKHITKTGDDWVVTGLPANLWAWLRRHRGEGAIRFPSSRPLDRMRRVWEAEKLVEAWPQNALRHSFATYHMSLSRSADKTAVFLRHRSTAMLWQSYLSSMVSAAEAGRYFKIEPAE